MAAIAHLRREERLGLGVALVAHVALFAGLLWHANKPAAVIEPQERMIVSLAEEVSLESTAPDPATEAPAAVAPVLAPDPAPAPPPAAEPVPPKPVERAIERPTPPKPQPRPSVAPPKAQPKPQPKPSAAPPKPRASASSAPRPAASAQPRPRPTSGGSRLGDDFLEGAGESQTANRGTPAATFGAAEQAALAQAINRQLKPHWAAPQGADAEKLVTILAFNLNQDGSLAGTPRLVRQEGITPSNEAQATRHAEQAIRAVRLAAPFDLPEQFYDKWKRVSSWRFDRKL
ncbi:hypothetical protein [Tsuneonella sp. HG222]